MAFPQVSLSTSLSILFFAVCYYYIYRPTPVTFLRSRPVMPVIDLQPLHDGTADAATLTAMGQQIANATATYGFFYVKGHGLSMELQQQISNASKEFFALPLEEKLPLSISGGGFTRGYVGVGGESGSDRLEVKEAFSWGFNWPEDRVPENALQGPNVWPQEELMSKNWREVMSTFYDKMIRASELVTKGISLALGKEEDYLLDYCTQGEEISLMRMFHYFPWDTMPQTEEDQRERIGSSPHTDWGFLTLILQDDVEGLQGYWRGEWHDLPVIPDTLLINCGDYLSILSGGRLRSPLHQVVSNGQERTSFVLFYYPSFDAKLEIDTDIAGQGEQDQSYSLLHNQKEGETGKQAVPAKTVKAAKSVKDVVSQQAFGEYITQKWAQVFRDPNEKQ